MSKIEGRPSSFQPGQEPIPPSSSSTSQDPNLEQYRMVRELSEIRDSLRVSFPRGTSRKEKAAARMQRFQNLVTGPSSQTATEMQEVTPTERDRVIRQAVREVRKSVGKDSLEDLYARTGLTPEMVQDAKSAGRKELVHSVRYFAGSEGLSTLAGWTAETAHLADLFTVNNLGLLVTAAVTGRVALIGMLAEKGRLNQRRIDEVDGVATDPIAKITHENGSGKHASVIGFIATNAGIEAYYAAQTAALVGSTGLTSGLIFDGAASWVSTAKVGLEDLWLRHKIRKARKEKAQKKIVVGKMNQSASTFSTEPTFDKRFPVNLPRTAAGVVFRSPQVHPDEASA